jgi:hypothetical protein
MLPADTQRKRRGHNFYPPKADRKKIPALYSGEDVAAADKVVVLHYFVGGCDWWLTEVDFESGMAFGFVNLGDPDMAEWGSVFLPELEAVKAHGWMVVERDCWWSLKKFSELKI